MKKKLLNVHEVCAIVNFGKTKLYQMINNGTFPPGLSDGRFRRWEENDILAFRILYWGTNEDMPPIKDHTLIEIEKCVERRKNSRNCARQ